MSDDRTHSLIPAVWVMLTNDTGQVFLLKRANTGWEDGKYVIPSGHVEANESPKQAAVRELEEETGIKANEQDLEFRHIVFNKSNDGSGTERVSVFFAVRSYSGTPTNAEPNKASECGWFDMHSLPELTSTNLHAFDAISRGEIYSELYY